MRLGSNSLKIMRYIYLKHGKAPTIEIAENTKIPIGMIPSAMRFAIISGFLRREYISPEKRRDQYGRYKKGSGNWLRCEYYIPEDRRKLVRKKLIEMQEIEENEE